MAAKTWEERCAEFVAGDYPDIPIRRGKARSHATMPTRANRNRIAKAVAITPEPTTYAEVTKYVLRERWPGARVSASASNLSNAYRTLDYSSVIAAIRERCAMVGDCWEWRGRTGKAGYPTYMYAGKTLLVHRMMLEAKLEQKTLGTLHAHHTCANYECVNPDHLDAVGPECNAAEMRERQEYVRFIRKALDAVREVNPDHPILNAELPRGVAARGK